MDRDESSRRSRNRRGGSGCVDEIPRACGDLRRSPLVGHIMSGFGQDRGGCGNAGNKGSGWCGLGRRLPEIRNKKSRRRRNLGAGAFRRNEMSGLRRNGGGGGGKGHIKSRWSGRGGGSAKYRNIIARVRRRLRSRPRGGNVVARFGVDAVDAVDGICPGWALDLAARRQGAQVERDKDGKDCGFKRTRNGRVATTEDFHGIPAKPLQKCRQEQH